MGRQLLTVYQLCTPLVTNLSPLNESEAGRSAAPTQLPGRLFANASKSHAARAKQQLNSLADRGRVVARSQRAPTHKGTNSHAAKAIPASNKAAWQTRGLTSVGGDSEAADAIHALQLVASSAYGICFPCISSDAVTPLVCQAVAGRSGFGTM